MKGMGDGGQTRMAGLGLNANPTDI
jgi:hypothetical protein